MTPMDWRHFFRATATGGLALPLAQAAHASHHEALPPGTKGGSQGYGHLQPPEETFMEVPVLHVVPAADLPPDGMVPGIPVFIDRALHSACGHGDELHLAGPFATGTPNQGYQLPPTPADPTIPIAAHAYYAAEAIIRRYLRNPGLLV